MIATYKNRPESTKTIYNHGVIYGPFICKQDLCDDRLLSLAPCRAFLCVPKNKVVKNVSSNCDGRLTVICADSL